MRLKKADVLRLLAGIKVSKSGCWEWSGRLRDGYGIVSVGGKSRSVHRVMWELMKDSEIPKDMQLDHLCKNRKCCNTDHLELVTGKQNTLRGMGPTAQNARKNMCKYGHPLDEYNTYIRPDDGARECRICAREMKRKSRAKQKGQIE